MNVLPVRDLMREIADYVSFIHSYSLSRSHSCYTFNHRVVDPVHHSLIQNKLDE